VPVKEQIVSRVRRCTKFYGYKGIDISFRCFPSCFADKILLLIGTAVCMNAQHCKKNGPIAHQAHETFMQQRCTAAKNSSKIMKRYAPVQLKDVWWS
jgi:hypothetical protein